MFGLENRGETLIFIQKIECLFFFFFFYFSIFPSTFPTAVFPIHFVQGVAQVAYG